VALLGRKNEIGSIGNIFFLRERWFVVIRSQCKIISTDKKFIIYLLLVTTTTHNQLLLLLTIALASVLIIMNRV